MDAMAGTMGLHRRRGAIGARTGSLRQKAKKSKEGLRCSERARVTGKSFQKSVNGHSNQGHLIPPYYIIKPIAPCTLRPILGRSPTDWVAPATAVRTGAMSFQAGEAVTSSSHCSPAGWSMLRTFDVFAAGRELPALPALVTVLPRTGALPQLIRRCQV